MDRLILFRHGKADPDSESGEDFDRRLAGRGVRESAETAQRLAQAGFAPDVALVSAAVRTRETWAAAQGAFPDSEARFERDLYLADAGQIRRLAADVDGAVMVVGHNPGLHDLTMRLLAQADAPADALAEASRRFPTATAAVFSFDGRRHPAFDGLFFPER